MLRAHTLIGLFLAAFVVLLVALMPAKVALSLALPPGVIEYGEVRGSVWRFTTLHTRVRGVDMGDVTIEPNFFALIFGGFSGPAAFDHAVRRGRADVEMSDTVSLTNIEFVTDMKITLSTQEVSGTLSGRGGALSFDRAGRCLEGRVPVRTNILEQAFQQYGLQAPLLEGEISCQNGLPTIQLLGQNGLLTFSAGGQYPGGNQVSLSFTLRFLGQAPLPSSLQSALQSAGLRKEGDAWAGSLDLEL